MTATTTGVYRVRVDVLGLSELADEAGTVEWEAVSAEPKIRSVIAGQVEYDRDEVRCALDLADHVPVTVFDARRTGSVRDAPLVVLDAALSRRRGGLGDLSEGAPATGRADLTLGIG